MKPQDLKNIRSFELFHCTYIKDGKSKGAFMFSWAESDNDIFFYPLFRQSEGSSDKEDARPYLSPLLSIIYKNSAPYSLITKPITLWMISLPSSQ